LSVEHGAHALLFIKRAVANETAARSTESLIESVQSSTPISRGNYINGLLGNDLKQNFMWDTLVGILYILGSEPFFGLQNPGIGGTAWILLNFSCNAIKIMFEYASKPKSRPFSFQKRSYMGLPFSLSPEQVERYARIICEWMAVRRHYDLFLWLQGEIQHYLPHEILLAAWGDFHSNIIRHDIVSALIGVRTQYSDVTSLSPLLQGLYNRWVELGRAPYELSVGETGLLLEERALQCPLGLASQGMQSILIHGISDKRGQHDCLYVIFGSRKKFASSSFSAFNILLPFLDSALGKIDPLPFHDQHGQPLSKPRGTGLSRRETEIMNWIKEGKTTSEIAAILGTSTFTVTSHLRNLFKKLAATPLSGSASH
jgi:transcriptional regulator EpsA